MAERTSDPFVVVRTLAAPRELMFAAMTQAEHLKHWMGPVGMVMSHCQVDLRPGGTFHYGLRAAGAAAGPVMWGKWTFREIVAPERLVVVVQFSDESGGVGRHPLAPDWPLYTLSTTTLADAGGITTLRLDWRALDATEAQEQLFNSSHAGMRQGWGGSMDQLDAYLASLPR